MFASIRTMGLYNGQNRGLRYNNTGVLSSPRQQFIEKCIRFYGAKFHFIGIPIGIIFVIIHLIFGIKYLHQCTIQPLIPIYMIVQASVVFGILLLTVIGMIIAHGIYYRSWRNNKMIARRLTVIVIILTLILFLFNFAWLVAGSVWVFRAESNGVQGSDSSATTTYCESNLYRAAFILIIGNYVGHALILLLLVIILLYIRWKRKRTVPPPVVTPNRFFVHKI